MITGNVNDFGTLGSHTYNFFENPQMGGRKVVLVKLPDINNIPIQN